MNTLPSPNNGLQPVRKKDVRYGDSPSGALIQPGDRVRLLTTVRHQDVAGLAGTVKRVVKSRHVVTVNLDRGDSYEALPANVEPLIQSGQ